MMNGTGSLARFEPANNTQKAHFDHRKKLEKAMPNMASDDKQHTTLSLSLTVADKKALNLMAMEQNTTIAAIIHEWISQHLKEEDK